MSAVVTAQPAATVTLRGSFMDRWERVGGAFRYTDAADAGRWCEIRRHRHYNDAPYWRVTTAYGEGKELPTKALARLWTEGTLEEWEDARQEWERIQTLAPRVLTVAEWEAEYGPRH